MGRLAQSTVNCYKSHLRKLRRVLPMLPEDHPEREKVIWKIERLTNQLGMEMTDLEIQLTRGPGRPRLQPELEGLLPAAEPKKAMTQEEREEVWRKNHEALREKIQTTDPEFIAEKDAQMRSEQALKEMMEMANETMGGGGTDERPDADADKPGSTPGSDKSA